jgi:hypothetical protein
MGVLPRGQRRVPGIAGDGDIFSGRKGKMQNGKCKMKIEN